MKPLAIGGAILAFLLFRGVCQHYTPRARVTAVEVVPVVVEDTTICKYIPEHVGCGGAQK